MKPESICGDPEWDHRKILDKSIEFLTELSRRAPLGMAFTEQADGGGKYEIEQMPEGWDLPDLLYIQKLLSKRRPPAISVEKVGKQIPSLPRRKAFRITIDGVNLLVELWAARARLDRLNPI